MLGRELARAGLVVVSGLARGVDAEAHRGALEAGATTVAVLGCGIDRDYPAAHARARAPHRRDAGSIVSEYAPGVEPAPWRFPARNRIVAGLCAAAVVVEARERSGALITADLALEEGREVFAVPGEITLGALRGDERAAEARRGAAHDARRRPRVVRASRKPRRPVERRPARPAARRPPTSSSAAPAVTAAEVARALVELELAGAPPRTTASTASAESGAARRSRAGRRARSRRSIEPRWASTIAFVIVRPSPVPWIACVGARPAAEERVRRACSWSACGDARS